jgi:hypothetical protein
MRNFTRPRTSASLLRGSVIANAGQVLGRCPRRRRRCSPPPIKQRVDAGTLRGAAAIGLAVGEVVNKRKVKKHFELEVTDERFDYQRKTEQLAPR